MKRIDMKKIYVVPSIEVVEVEHESLMLTASGETDSAGVGSGTAGNGPDLANERRGTWGDLWD